MAKTIDRRMTQTTMEAPQTENQNKITGYALKFNRDSEDMGFIERIDPHALDNTDMSTVFALLNHDENFVLGRIDNNLELEVDDIGLKFTLTPTNTSYSRDVIDNLKLGLIDKCSFSFVVAEDGDQWEYQEETDQYYRTITNIEKLYDVSIVTYPAYQDTEVVLSNRSLNKLDSVKNKRERELILLDLYIGGR